LLSAVVIIQLYDIKKLITNKDLKYGIYETPLNNALWGEIFKKFESAIVYPPFNYNYSVTYNLDYQDLCYLALKNHVAISNAYVARTDLLKTDNYKMKLEKNLNEGVLSPRQIFITTQSNLSSFGQLFHDKKIEVKRIDGFVLVYPLSGHKDLHKTLRFTNVDFQYLDSLYVTYKNVNKNTFRETNIQIKDIGEIKFNLDNFNQNANVIQMRGWAFLKNSLNTLNDSIYIMLRSNKKEYIIDVKREEREDISIYFKNKNLNFSGFYGNLDVKNIEKNVYEVGVLIKKHDKNLYFCSTGKKVKN
jgi:hypothetical protein